MRATALVLSSLFALAAPPPGSHGLRVLRPCVAPQLQAKVLASDQGMLHRNLRIALTNVSSQACAIDGYPAVRLLDADGNVAISAESFSRTPREFTIGHGQQAVFLLRVAVGDGVLTYPASAKLAIIPPGDIRPLTLPVALPAAPRIDVTALLPPADVP
ncbi:MAG TPA: DUF4232 domain-containing protein [Candidatus Acidoferrum sp.]|nr:DUF4232 domain-containing protein [Candidatus Acidoferrum sp.]